jgi:O-antigen/teichoic acid export membrane protein
MAGAVATAILTFVVVAVITRGLSKLDAGVVFTATSLFFLVESLARLGADVGIVHHLSGAMARGRQTAASDVLLASLIPVAIGATLAGAGLVALTVPVEHLVTGSHGSGHSFAIVVVLAVTMPFAATYDVMTAATRALGSARPTVAVERLLRPIAQLVAIGVALALGGDAAVVVAAWTLPYLPCFAVMAVWLLRMMRHQGVPSWSPGWRSVVGPVWRFTGPRAAASVMQSALQRLDIVLVGALVGLPAAAVYTGATRFVVVGQLGNQAVGYSTQPQLRRLLVKEERAAAFTLFQASTTWVIAMTWPLYLTVIALAPLLLRIFGSQYSGGETTAITVTSAMLVAAACGLVDIALLTVGKSIWNLGNVALGLVVNVTVDVILLPHIGIEGAAIGWAAAILLTNLVPLWQIHHTSGLHPASLPWLRTMVYALGCFLALPLIGRVIEPDHWIGGIAGVVVGGLLYLALMWRARAALGLDRLATSRRAGRRRAVPVKPGRHSAHFTAQPSAHFTAQPSSHSTTQPSVPPSAQTTDPPPAP